MEVSAVIFVIILNKKESRSGGNCGELVEIKEKNWKLECVNETSSEIVNLIKECYRHVGEIIERGEVVIFNF